MPHAIESSTFRILRPDGKTVGTGFLVASNLAVTCAHVVVAADAIDGDTIQVQFTERDEKHSALVVPEYWRNPDKGDVAFLRLQTMPEGVTPLRLGLAEHSHQGNIFRSFGYATAADIKGIFANGTIDGYMREHQLVQVQSPQANHGISGGPVFDEKRGVVVGMITKGHTDLGRNEYTTFAIPAELLFDICPEIRPSETCPYLGLDAFGEADARFFYGRRRVVARLLESLRHNPRFLAVLGLSGSGKSSVVQAGLLPELRNGAIFGSEKWQYFQIRPGDDPFLRLDSAGLQETGSGLVAALSKSAQTHSDVHPVLIVDQFEELFTSTPADLREKFLRGLAELLESDLPVTVLLTLRDDFYSTFTRQSAALTRWLERGQVNVEAILVRDNLREIIAAPAELVGLGFEPGLVETLLDDVTGSQGEGASTLLPLLEFALTQLWERRAEGLLTHAAYQKLGGVTGGLVAWADRAYRALPAGQRDLVRHVLTYLVHLGDEKQNLPDTRRRMTLLDLTPSGASADEVRGVVKSLADARLLVTHGDEVEITHEILLRSWPQLHEWLNDDRENLRFHNHLTESAREWERRHREPGELYRGARLAQTQEWAKTNHALLSPLENAFLQVAQTEHQRERRATSLRWASFAGAGLLVVLTVALALTGQLNPLIYRPVDMPAEYWRSIPAGMFQMGSENGESDEKPVHTVKLDAFKMGRYEVTNRQYAQCVKAGACNVPGNSRYSRDEYALHPVTYVSWDNAQDFCSWVGGRLPSEAEWEYAARGGLAGRNYPWGDEEPSCERSAKNGANFYSGENCPQDTLPVGSYPPTGYGLYDMAGNVWEWVNDWYSDGYYATLEETAFNPTGPQSGDTRVLRGGSWGDFPGNLRVSLRIWLSPVDWDYINGFRCAR
jgi:formylglycine-generating enzyme required for sulfatase activity